MHKAYLKGHALDDDDCDYCYIDNDKTNNFIYSHIFHHLI